MQRAAAALLTLVAALVPMAVGSGRHATGAIDGTWESGSLSVRIAGSTGTVIAPGHFSVNTGTEPLCRHQADQVIFTGIAGSGTHYTGSFALLAYANAGADGCVPDTPRAAAFDLVGTELRVCVANSSGTIDTSSTTLCKRMSRVSGSTAPATPTRLQYLLLVSARADAVRMKGIPGAKFYATSDVHGAGKVDTDPRLGPDIVDGTGTVKVKHEFLSDQLPDITMTLKILGKGGVVKSGGKPVVTVDVTVIASSVKGCMGATGTMQLSEGPPAAVVVTVCRSSFALVDGKGPKGPDPTNDVQVKIET